MFWESKCINLAIVCFGLFLIGFFLGCTYASRVANKKINALKKAIHAQKRQHDTVLANYRKHHGQHPDCPNFPVYPSNYPNGYGSAPVDTSSSRTDRTDRERHEGRSRHRG